MLVELTKACQVDNRFWVSLGVLTSNGFTLTVTDTKTGQVKTYDNELGTPAQPIQDTSAFATCP